MTDKQMALLIAAGVLGVWLLKRQTVAAVTAVGQAVNPVSQDNIFYGGVNAIGEKLTGGEDFTLGGWIYDLTHPTSAAQQQTEFNLLAAGWPGGEFNGQNARNIW